MTGSFRDSLAPPDQPGWLAGLVKKFGRGVMLWIKRNSSGFVVGIIVTIVGGLVVALFVLNAEARRAKLHLSIRFTVSERLWNVDTLLSRDSTITRQLWVDFRRSCTVFDRYLFYPKEDVAVVGNVARYERQYVLENPNDLPISNIRITSLSSLVGDWQTRSTPNVDAHYEKRADPGWPEAGVISVPVLPAGGQAVVSAYLDILPEAYDRRPDLVELQAPKPTSSEVPKERILYDSISALAAALLEQRLNTGSPTPAVWMPDRSVERRAGFRVIGLVEEQQGSRHVKPSTCGYVSEKVFPKPEEVSPKPATRDAVRSVPGSG